MHRRWVYLRGRDAQRSSSDLGSGLCRAIICTWSRGRPQAKQFTMTRSLVSALDCSSISAPSQPSRQRRNVLLESRHIRLISPLKTFLTFQVMLLEFVFGFCAVEFVQIEKRLFRGQSDLLVPVKPPGRDCKLQHKHDRDERQKRSDHADG